MATILLYGDTVRHPALRHEVPLEIIDPFLFVERDGQAHVLTSPLESARIAATRPDAELAMFDQLGLFELIEGGLSRDDAEREVVVRALEKWGVGEATVSPDLPVGLADRLRDAGVRLVIDAPTIEGRRRVKTEAELAGIRRAQRAAEAGMAAGEQLIRGAERRDGRLFKDGEALTAQAVRAAVRGACAAAGAPAPPDIMVVSKLSSGGHDPGSGPLPDTPIEIDLWPRDEESGCWADMTRTFLAGEVTAEVAALRDTVRDAIESVRAAARPGITGRDLYDVAAGIVEAAGYPTQRTREPGQTLTRGFYFSLGHGVGLEVHEPPGLGLAGGSDVLVPGDVIAVEPGIEGIEGIGGVRYEDLLLITDDGCETLTRYPYDL